MKGTEICLTAEDCRRAFKSTARWLSVRKAVLADHSVVCYLCGGAKGPIRHDLKGPHPLSASADHIEGFRVEDQIGKPVYEVRRICCDIDGLRPVHFGCNAIGGNQNRHDNEQRGWFKKTEPLVESEPMNLARFRHRTSGEEITLLSGPTSVLSEEWEEVPT